VARGTLRPPLCARCLSRHARDYGAVLPTFACKCETPSTLTTFSLHIALQPSLLPAPISPPYPSFYPNYLAYREWRRNVESNCRDYRARGGADADRRSVSSARLVSRCRSPMATAASSKSTEYFITAHQPSDGLSPPSATSTKDFSLRLLEYSSDNSRVNDVLGLHRHCERGLCGWRKLLARILRGCENNAMTLDLPYYHNVYDILAAKDWIEKSSARRITQTNKQNIHIQICKRY